MKEPDRAEPSPWADALLGARLLAIDPHGLGGVRLRALPGPARERWLAFLRERLGEDRPMRRLPLHVTDSRLLGGLDLAATLRAGRPIAERGILADCDRGVLVAAMAERMSPGTAARIAAALDRGALAVERDGLAIEALARVGIVALDEGMTADEQPPSALLDRLAFWFDLAGIHPHSEAAELDPAGAGEACHRLSSTQVSEEAVAALCQAAMALGIASLRAPVLAIKAARAHAALAGRLTAAEPDIVAAARLVLAPRATVLPVAEPPPQEEQADQSDRPPSGDADDDGAGRGDRPLADQVIEAARAAIPAGLLDALRGCGHLRRRGSRGGGGLMQKSQLRGRPAGVRRGDRRVAARLNVVETLRAAAPWQPLRRRERAQALGERSESPVGSVASASKRGASPLSAVRADRSVQPRTHAEAATRIEVRRDDFRITRFKQRMETTTIFVVDASGSAALHRLAEAKGAVELMLAECYVRRDAVALIAFRGRQAELLLPPTRSLARAKRNLAALPGGGGTPLATAIELAVLLADQVTRRGQSAHAIFLTDGQANIARDGAPGRGQAEEDALAAARALRLAGLAALFVDTAPHPKPFARKLAEQMGAAYLALPHANAMAISAAALAAASPRK